MKKITILFLCVVIIACKQKKKQNDQESFFPVLSFIKSQVAHVDTSFYAIRKITWLDSVHFDTTYIKREDFAELAKDFLEMPDLSSKEYRGQYAEEKLYDAGMNLASLRYKAKNPETAIIQFQEVQIAPDPTGDKVNSFYIHLIISTKDSSVEKKMWWQVNKNFHVYSSIQKPDGQEITRRFKVIWNDNE